MHRERVLKALAQLLVGVENKLHLADRRRRREDKLIERARLLEIQRAQNKTNLKDADANGKISYRIGAYMQMKKLEEERSPYVTIESLNQRSFFSSISFFLLSASSCTHCE